MIVMLLPENTKRPSFTITRSETRMFCSCSKHFLKVAYKWHYSFPIYVKFPCIFSGKCAFPGPSGVKMGLEDTQCKASYPTCLGYSVPSQSFAIYRC